MKKKDANKVLKQLQEYNQAKTEIGLQFTKYKGVLYSNEHLLKRLLSANQSGDRKMMLTFARPDNKTHRAEYPGNLQEFMEVVNDVNKLSGCYEQGK